VDSRRAESFSDGVFAVAITVLVFNLLAISPPDGFGKLTAHWPEYAAYVVSFLTIGIMWLNHHTMLSHASKINRTALVLNIFLLMGVVAVPFPTGLVAGGLAAGAPAGATKVAAVAYGLVMTGTSVAFSALWLYLSSHGDPSLAARPRQQSRQASLRFGAGLLGYIAATVIAALGAPMVALGIYGLLAVYYLFEHLPGPAARDAGAGGQNDQPAGHPAAR